MISLSTPTEAVRILNTTTALVAPNQLMLAPVNPRRGDIEALKQSFLANGFYGTVLVDTLTGWVIAGNHRVRAACELEMPEIPVTYLQCDSETHARRLLVADNRISDLATNDTAELTALLREILDVEGDLEGTGYTDDDLRDLLDDLGSNAFVEGLTDEDDAPDLPDETRTVSREGDIWQIGPHRIGCGSSTDLTHVRNVLDGRAPMLCWTDPPYNVNYEGKTKDRLKIANDAMTPEQFGLFMRAAMNATFEVLAPGACIYVAYAELEAVNFYGAFREAGFHYSQTRIWVKNAGVLGRQDYNWRHEPIIYGWKPGAGHYFNQDFTQTSVIDQTPDYRKMTKDDLVALLEKQLEASTVIYADKPVRNGLHPTMKPPELIREMILASSRTGDLVYDPFGGSGSTLIASHQTNRACCTNDLDPRYVDVMVRRIQEFSGLIAVDQAGVAFDERATKPTEPP